jgi:Holliday junction resolvase-like predicted endonuclease
MDVTTDWFWEGNVVESLARHLSEDGWRILSKANTHSKERGVDIHASKGGTTLLIEAKGFPSKEYRDPRRAGEQKRTNPTNQAQQWYSHALLKALRLQTKYPNAKVALAFPDFPRYRALFEETHGGFEKLGLALLLVEENGNVEEFGLIPSSNQASMQTK